MRDAYSNTAARVALAAGPRSASANGTSVDRAGGGALYQDALILVHAGTITDGTHTIDVQESDNDSTWTPVAVSQLQGSKPALVAADSGKVRAVGYRGTKRFLRVSVSVNGATTGGTYGVLVLLGSPRTAGAVQS
ncbi:MULTISPECIES: hypothetical protein [unclassified Streptomyces]|uniref:hypothetical protein n=1 Tax=unclassified Streptomyces TaxID=2593676 RepID=UPI001CD73093|nr:MULTISPECIES: hypothetical protein [unclassified Streptomyces]